MGVNWHARESGRVCLDEHAPLDSDQPLLDVPAVADRQKVMN
jgi:hypothetical protein